MRKKIPISYSEERAVLSDILPYETPVTFSNRYFYNYLIERKKNNFLSKTRKDDKVISTIESILFNKKVKEIVPFRFKIKHKKNDFRELTIIHPQNQQKVVDFYKKNKNLILYYCSLSPFSIRKPSKVANYIFYNDILHKRNEDKDLQFSQIEQDDSEYENLKSFFSYQKYSNIHKFYESYQFHRSEKKYNKLLKIDVTKCFDSIYSHTISWAIFNKKVVKTNIKSSERTFAGSFDRLMQELNANETNGIVIGPEFSRIFAELILQQIDINIHGRLKKKDTEGRNLIHKVDYETFRYVDDYFIFYNSDVDIERIKKAFKLSLKEYKMYLNDSKSISYSKPIITEISIAKQKINDLFKNHLLLKEKEVSENEKPVLYFSSNNVITRFKSIIKESEISYADIMNYTLAVIDKRTQKLISKYIKLKEEDVVDQKIFEKGFLEILDVAFFLYSVSPKVNSTIKICLIVNKIITFLKKNKTNNYIEPFSSSKKHNIFKKISDEINLILKKNKSEKETQIESLYLLITLSQIGREYRLNPRVLCSYFGAEINKNKTIVINSDLNYFSITVLLFYIKDIKIYAPLQDSLKRFIVNKYKEELVTGWENKTELVLLLFDIITCPYLDTKLEKTDKETLIQHIEDIHTCCIKNYDNEELYISELKNNLKKLYNSKALKKIEKESYKRVFFRSSEYLKELEKSIWIRNSIYKKEESFVNELIGFKEIFQTKVDKYSYKKRLLTLLNIKNQIPFIEFERFWFTKWTEFDLGLELQAKRSQEVY